MESLKVLVAKKALEYIKDGMVLGLGSGTTVAEFIKLLGNLVRVNEWKIWVIPTSFDSEILALRNNLHVVTLDEYPEPELAIDGADEVDPHKNLIKGGGGAMMREKIIDYAAKKLLIIVDESKLVNKLCEKRPIPLEVLPFAWRFVINELNKLKGKAIIRPCAGGKIGPIVTDNGNLIVDYFPEKPLENPEEVEITLKSIPGVLETGIFLGKKVWKVLVGCRGGTVRVIE